MKKCVEDLDVFVSVPHVEILIPIVYTILGTLYIWVQHNSRYLRQHYQWHIMKRDIVDFVTMPHVDILISTILEEAHNYKYSIYLGATKLYGGLGQNYQWHRMK